MNEGEFSFSVVGNKQGWVLLFTCW
jgi:hypothetical protein